MMQDSQHEYRWRVRFEALVEFKKQHGHCNVPRHYKEDPQLGFWMISQRKAKAGEKLIPERERRLEGLGFVWSTSKDERWEEMFRELEEFKKEHGHCSVPNLYGENPKLGVWVTRQRTAKAEEKLASERERRLEGLGFIWSVLDERWEEMFRQLEEFQMEHGHCNVPRHYKKNPKLRTWVLHQREQANRKGKLPPERERRLERLGFVWMKSRDERWEEMFWQLEDFQMEHGHCNVPNHYKENSKLGNWVGRQRVAKYKRKLPHERERRLKNLGFFGSRKFRSENREG